jgi:splicing factor 3B subunit 2
VSVDVDQLGDDDKLDKDTLKKEYESRQKAAAAGQWQSIDQEDLADMIANESRKRVKRDDDRKTRRRAD